MRKIGIEYFSFEEIENWIALFTELFLQIFLYQLYMFFIYGFTYVLLHPYLTKGFHNVLSHFKCIKRLKNLLYLISISKMLCISITTEHLI